MTTGGTNTVTVATSGGNTIVKADASVSTLTLGTTIGAFVWLVYESPVWYVMSQAGVSDQIVYVGVPGGVTALNGTITLDGTTQGAFVSLVYSTNHWYTTSQGGTITSP